MFGIFKPRQERAATAAAEFIGRMLEPFGQLHPLVLDDPYCIGFLQMVGVHAASKALGRGAGIEAGYAAFEGALRQFAPRHHQETAHLLSLIRSEGSPYHEAYLDGSKDGDLYMGWKLLGLAPQSHGSAALKRFFDRARELDDPPLPPRLTTEAEFKRDHRPPSVSPPKPSTPHGAPGKVRVDWGDWTIINHDLVRQYDFQNLPFAEKLTLQIRITVEMGSFGFTHSHPHLIMQPPISQEREIVRTILVDTEDGSVEVGPMEVTVALVPGNASMFWFSGENHKKLLTVLWSMKRIRFLLLEPDGRTIQMALPLETGDYRDAFSRIQKQVTGGS